MSERVYTQRELEQIQCQWTESNQYELEQQKKDFNIRKINLEQRIEALEQQNKLLIDTIAAQANTIITLVMGGVKKCN
jgi:hypothetical protein